MKPPIVRSIITLSIAALTLTAQARNAKNLPQPAAAKVAPDAVLAPSYILLDPVSGRILEERNAHARMFPASTTKTMMALVAIESGKLDEITTIGPNPPKTGEQSINLQQGERFVVRDLVRAALIKSANDACVAVAEAVAGDVPSFAKMMNEKAKQVGALNSHFVNPHGLHNADHYTTAYDLALIARAAMRHSEFNEIVRTQRSQVHGNAKIGPVRPLMNRNRLLFRWAECDGIKTGYTKQAGRCLIASATRLDPATKEPWRLLSVVLHSPNSWQDSQTLIARHGFAHFQPYLAAHNGQVFGDANVQNGGTTQAVLPSDAMLTLRAAEKGTLRSETRFRSLTAPVRAGQRVGTLTYFAGERAVAVLPLVAQSDVSGSAMARVLPASMGPLVLAGARFLPTLLLGLLAAGGLKLSYEKRQRTAARRKTRRVASASGGPTRAGHPQSRRSAPSGGSRQRPASAAQSIRRQPRLGEQFVAQHLADEAENRDLASERTHSKTGPAKRWN